MAMKSFFFGRHPAIARLVPELVPPISMSTPAVSNHSRALGGGDVGLVLVVGEYHLDLLAAHRAAHVGHRHLDGLDAAGAVDVGVQARHVGDDADLDDVARDLGVAPVAAASVRALAATIFLSFAGLFSVG